MLVHHFPFHKALIILPDTVFLIYLEPVMAEELKTIRAGWKHLFLKLATFLRLR